MILEMYVNDHWIIIHYEENGYKVVDWLSANFEMPENREGAS